MLLKRNRLPLHALRTFEAAAHHRNLTKAAEELGVTHSAVSHQIKSLEDILRVRLFDRQRRPLVLTAEGEKLLRGVVDAYDRLTQVTGEIGSGDFEGEAKISCVPGLAANWLVPSLGDFIARYAKVQVHVITDYWRHQTTAEEADLRIIYGSAEHPGKRVILLGHCEFFPVCSPRLLSPQTHPRDPAEILRFNLLHEYTSETWLRWFAAAGVPDPDLHRSIFFDSAHLSLQAARSGYGVAMGDTHTVAVDLKEGRLVRLFSTAVPAMHPYYLVTPPLERMKPIIQALEFWIVDCFKLLENTIDSKELLSDAGEDG